MNTDQFVCQFPVVPDSLNSLVTQVILIRHGLSTFNQQGRMQGSSDESRLTEHGRRTARQVGQWLHGVAIDAVYSSPLQRAHATAEEIVGQMSSSRSIPLYTDSRLREVDLPAWEGRSFQHIRTLFSEDYRCWKQRPHQLQMETFSASTALSRSLEQSMGVTQAVATLAPERRFPALDLYDRAMQFWQDILPRRVGETLVVVSHNSANHALLSTAIGLSAAQHHRIQQSNCAINLLQFPLGRLHLAHVPLINSTQPLGETLPPLKEGNLGLRLLLLPSEQAESYLGRSQALAEARIDFCLNCQNDDIPLKIDPFLCHHPETFYFLIQPDSVPTVWQPPTTDSTQLTTGLIIAPADELAAIIGQAIGLDPDHYWRIAPVPGTLSVLHYPSTDHPPILQALNWA